MYRAVAKIDTQIPFDHDERLVSVFMIVPDEVTVQLHNLEMVIVHFGDHFRLPLLIEQAEQAKLLHKADCSVFHLNLLDVSPSSHPAQRKTSYRAKIRTMREWFARVSSIPTPK